MAEKVLYNGKPLIPSKYLEAADLNGKRVAVVIERIAPRMELQSATGKKDKRPVFFLKGKEKGWVLNKTNLNRIAQVYGKNAETWVGKTVVLYAERVESFGDMVPAVRVDVDATQARANGGTPGRNAPPVEDSADDAHGGDDFDGADDGARELSDDAKALAETIRQNEAAKAGQPTH